MHIFKGIETYAANTSQQGNLFQSITKRVYISGWFYGQDGTGKLSHKAAIAIGVSIGVGCLFLICLPFLVICFRTKWERRKARKQKKRAEREKLERLIPATIISGGEINEMLIPNSTHNNNDTNEEAEQAILRPSDAVLRSANGLFSSESTKYEYEPLPPYEMLESSISPKKQTSAYDTIMGKSKPAAEE